MAKTFFEVKIEEEDAFTRRLAAINAFQQQYPEVPNLCQQIEEIQVPEGVNLAAWWGYQWGGSLTVTLTGLTSFKDELLTNLLETLMAKYNAEFSSSDSPEYFTRMFSAPVHWENGNFDIHVEARVKNDSTGCTRVQVGVETKTVETPIYRLDCQGEEHVD